MLDDLIVGEASSYGIDPDLVRALITKESNYNTWAMRFEPSVYVSCKYLLAPEVHASKLIISVETEKVCQSTSWGLMQVMGFTARELEFDAELPKLLTPELGIRYGCKKLKKLFEKYNEESDVIAAYNAGGARKTPGGMYVNQTYVDGVHFYLTRIRKI
jgi:soluble lytic murein transglycosylase-like protein